MYSIDIKKRALNHFCYPKALEYPHNAKIDLAHAYKERASTFILRCFKNFQFLE